jgi:hypothetical protein
MTGAQVYERGKPAFEFCAGWIPGRGGVDAPKSSCCLICATGQCSGFGRQGLLEIVQEVLRTDDESDRVENAHFAALG